MILLIVFILITLIVSFVCSFLEATLLSVTKPFIDAAEAEGKPVRYLRKMKNNADKSLSAILSLNTIANTVGSAGVGMQTARIAGDASFGIVSACFTFLILVFAEIVPKTIGTTYWRKTAIFAGYTVYAISFPMYPLVVLSQLVTRLFSKDANTVSREEVAALASIGSREGIFEEKESTVIQNIIHLKDKKVRDIMTPRIVICSASEEMTLKEFFEKEEFLQHSRIPIYETSSDNITGYVLKMDVLENIAKNKSYLKLKIIQRDILVFYENFSVSGLFDALMSRKEHISLIVDEFGSVAGIATMEDIIETLLGMEIIDEHDRQVDMQQHAKEKWEERSQNIDI